MRINRTEGFAISSAGGRVRTVATAMLLVMAALFFATHWLAAITPHPPHPLIGYVRAFAEAAMVGGLADWFAVTALFRRPLGLPIPHTAIIPRNKDRIGDTLAAFIRTNFLVPRLIARRMQRIDIAGAVGRFLSDPSISEGRMRSGASRMIADMLGALDQDRLGGMAKSAIAERIRELNVAPLLGQALTAAMADGRHQPLLDSVIRWAGGALDSNEHLIHALVHERANTILRLTGLDETIANSIIKGLHTLLHDMAADPGHPMRLKIEEGLEQLAFDLNYDPDMQARVARIRDELMENKAVKRWLDSIWEQGRAALLRAARDPASALAGRLGDVLRQLGGSLTQDARLNRTLNRFARRAAVGAVDSYGDAAVRLVSDTVRGWDVATVTDRLEGAVGRDLQYIRINGTVVGGLVGVVIHAVEMLL